MTQEHKEILIRDLCGRLPYWVKAYIKKWSKLDRKYYEGVYTVESIDTSLNTIIADSERSCVEVIVGYDDSEIKPYLFPLSSMTDEQAKEIQEIVGNSDDACIIRKTDGLELWLNFIDTDPTIWLDTIFEVQDYLNKNHFDYRGLISMGLAIDATGLNIY